MTKPEPFMRPLLQRLLRLGIAVMVLAGVVLAGRALLLDPQLFPLERIRITSELQRVTQQELRAAVDPFTHEGVFGMDVAGVREAVRALPWVQDAVIRRAWPDAVVIRVYEQHPIARWGEQELINQRGERFHVPNIPAGMARLIGPDGHEAEVVEQYRRLGGQLNGIGLGLSELRMDERKAWHLTLNNGLRVTLGRDDLERRMLRFTHVYPKVIAQQLIEIDGVDLRYPNGLAIAWHPEQADG